jgi:hypothetical protein
VEDKNMSDNHEDVERELDRSALMGFSYVGSKPATMQDAIGNLKAFGNWLRRSFGRAAKQEAESRKKISTPSSPEP